ncbi:MAG TPA: glycosyltransferase family 9 protein, partial [Brevundimonas sp.]|nr:glycosyltransferase family 9 protein [Brevundimonas sp.]
REAGVHAVELAARVLHLDEIPTPRLALSEESIAAADRLIPAAEGPILAVAPGAEWMGRQWPPERFAKVATALLADDGAMAGGRLMIIGGDGDREAAHAARSAVRRERVIDLQGRLSPLQTVAALKRAKLYLGADSLWTHLAVAAGVPVVAAFGPSDEVERGPWGGVVVRGPRSVDEFRKIDPQLNQAIQHMNDLPAERVLKAAKKLLEQRVGA